MKVQGDQGHLWKHHLLVLGLYTILALATTWPSVKQISSHLPGDGGDDPAIAWNLWWLKYSLLNEPQNPLHSEMMFFPVGINLAFYTHTLLNGLSSLPLLLNFGTTAASNLHLFFSLLIGAYGGFLVLRYYLNKAPEFQQATSLQQEKFWIAFLGGLMLGYSSSRLFYVSLGQFNIASSHWIPFCILFFLKMHDQPKKWSWAVLCALFLVMQAWTEMTYASFLIIFMLIYWLYWLIADQSRTMISWPFIRAGLILIFLFSLGLSPLLGAMIPDLLVEGDFFVEGGGFADIFSTDIAGFLIPPVLHPWLGHVVSESQVMRIEADPAIQHVYKGQHIYLGYTLLALVGLALLIYRRSLWLRFWGLASLCFAYLSLGPYLIFHGQVTNIPGLFSLLQKVPFFNGNRYPSRFSVLLLLCLMPLFGAGLYKLFHKLKQSSSPKGLPVLLTLLIAALYLFEHSLFPLPQSDMRVPAIYQKVAADPAAVSLLDIPFAWRNGFRITGAYTTGFMFGQFYQTQHQKAMLQGNTSRNPNFKFQYFTEAPVLDSLRILETGHDLEASFWERDKLIGGAVLQFFGIKYLVVRPEPPGYLNHPQASLKYIEEVLPATLIEQTEAAYLYQADWPPYAKEIDLLRETPLRSLYFAEGWGVPQKLITAQRSAVDLLLPLNGQAQKFRAQVRLPEGIDLLSTQMYLQINGWQSPPLDIFQEWQSIESEIPAEAVNEGLNRVTLTFDHQPVNDISGLNLTLISAGEESGNLGQILLNGQDISPGKRGYNGVILSDNGVLIQAQAFDTHFDPQASHALAQFIAQAPEGSLIALVVKDEASQMLDEVAIQALQSIGGQVDLRTHFRASHVLIGQKGGPALAETWAQHHPAKAQLGLGLTEDKVFALFQKIHIESQ